MCRPPKKTYVRDHNEIIDIKKREKKEENSGEEKELIICFLLLVYDCMTCLPKKKKPNFTRNFPGNNCVTW